MRGFFSAGMGLAVFLLWTCLFSACVPLTRQREPAELTIDNRGAVPLTPIRFTLDSTVIDPGPAAVEIPGELSVEQAVLLTLRNNRDLRVQQLTPVVTGTFEQIEKGVFAPELVAEIGYNKEKTSETSRSSGTRFNVEATETVETVGVNQYLPTGTSLEIALEHSRNTSNRTPEQEETLLGLSLTQALLRDFGPAVNLAGVRQAELDTLASIDELRGYTETLVATTEKAYWHYVLAKEEIAIFASSLDVAQQQLEDIELRIEVGILPDIEAAAARTEKALRVQALIDARSQLEERRLQLLRLIGPDDGNLFDKEIELISELRLRAKPVADLHERIRLAEKSRPDLSEARHRLRRRSLGTMITRNGLLPRLELFIALDKTGFGARFSDSVSHLDDDTYDFNAGLRLSHFLDNRAARARNLAAFAGRQQASEAVANLRQLVELDVRLAVNEVERSRQQISASRETRIAQEQTLAAEKERFDVGTSTALEVAQAQRDLLSSRIAEIESIVNYRMALVDLYLAEGSLLARRGIDVLR